MFRIVEITRCGTKLQIRNACLEIIIENQLQAVFPVNELSALLISEPAVSFSGFVPAVLAEKKIPLIICNGKMVPGAILYPCSSNADFSNTLLEAQISVGKPFKKRIWQKLISAKITGQSCVLKKWRQSNVLENWSKEVSSGDRENLEGQAAAVYWRQLGVFPKRDRSAEDANRLFNYTYTVLFAAFAREIAVAGLFPKLGVFHHHRNNPFPLASDLMEPFRAVMDEIILGYLEMEPAEYTLSPATRKELLKRIYSFRLLGEQGRISLFDACRSFVQSYKKALLANQPALLHCPQWKGALSGVGYCSI